MSPSVPELFIYIVGKGKASAWFPRFVLLQQTEGDPLVAVSRPHFRSYLIDGFPFNDLSSETGHDPIEF
jgi:hypothetical protein